jgi:hypothetical protein
MALVETGRFREKFDVSCDKYHVYMDVSQGTSGPTITLHFGFSPNIARELAYKMLAAAEECERKKMETK